MAFSGSGKFRVLLQRYQYKSHNIFCIIKILPEKVELFEKEPHNDFDWMTSNRWTKIENALNRLFASFKNWPNDTRKLKINMLIDHIKVSIATSEELLPAARELLGEDVQPKNELSLEIIVSYMSHEDTTIVSDKLALGKSVQKGNNSTAEDGTSKIKLNTVESAISNKMKSASRDRNANYRLHTNDAVASDYLNRETSNRKNKRRSLSQDNRSTQEVSPVPKAKLNSSSEHTEKRSKSPSGTSSTEPKAGRRSARSPAAIPTRFKEFVLSDKGHRKRKQILHCDASTAKQSSSKPTESTGIDSQESRVMQDGAQRNLGVFQELDKLLITPKPRKVRIILLEDMDEAAVMKTFESYKSDFDRLFKERRHKDYTNNYLSIDHSHIMDILSKTIRDSMLKKLADVYCKASPHGSLVINGLLPLWIIRLFMDKFELTQQEAVDQISDQLHYHTYLKAINNEGLEDY